MTSLKFIFILFFSTIALPCIIWADDCNPIAITVATTPVPPGPPAWYSRSLDLAKNIPAQADLVFLGDSLLAGWGDKPAQEFPNSNIWNFSVVGDRTQQVLWRLKQAQLGKLSPRSVLIWIGTNNLSDSGSTACSTFKGIQEIVRRTRTTWPKADIFVLTIAPRGDNFRSLDEQRVALNKMILEDLAKQKRVFPIAIDDNAFTCGYYGNQAALPDAQARCMQPKTSVCQNYQPDYLHLSRQGYVTLRSMLNDYSIAKFGLDRFAATASPATPK